MPHLYEYRNTTAWNAIPKHRTACIHCGNVIDECATIRSHYRGRRINIGGRYWVEFPDTITCNHCGEQTPEYGYMRWSPPDK